MREIINNVKEKRDNKIFSLPRRFSRSSCKKTIKKGFTMRSSCASYKYCNNKINKLRTRRTHKNRKKVFEKKECIKNILYLNYIISH